MNSLKMGGEINYLLMIYYWPEGIIIVVTVYKKCIVKGMNNQRKYSC